VLDKGSAVEYDRGCDQQDFVLRPAVGASNAIRPPKCAPSMPLWTAKPMIQRARPREKSKKESQATQEKIMRDIIRAAVPTFACSPFRHTPDDRA
jgi:hypothetical protein